MEKASEHAWVTHEKVNRLRRRGRYAKQGQRDGDRKRHLKDQGMAESEGHMMDRRLREGWTGLAHKGRCPWIGELINKRGAESLSENSP